MFKNNISRLPGWVKIILKDNITNVLSNYNNTPENCYPNKDNVFNFMIGIDDIKLIILVPSPSYIWHNETITIAGKNIENCLKKNNLLDFNSSIEQDVWKVNGILVFPYKLIDEEKEIDTWRNITDILLNKIVKNKCVLMFGKFSVDFKDSETLKWNSPNIKTTVGKNKFMECPHFVYINKKYNVSFEETYSQKTIEFIEKNSEEKVEMDIFTDGGCDNNGKKNSTAGSAIVFKESVFNSRTYVNYFKISHSVIENKIIYPTSQRAEGFAILHALKYLEEQKHTNKYTINIITDSEFWIKMITIYMPKWFDGTYDNFKLRANSDITINIHKLNSSLSNRYNIIFKHIKSHNKDLSASTNNIVGNDIADRYASIAKRLNHFKIVSELL